MKKKDVFLILIVVFLAGVGLLANKIIQSGAGEKVEIYVDNKLYESCPIDEDKVVKIDRDGHENIIKIHDHGVEMTEANCPDHVCVKTGFITKPEESIVCMPHKVSVKIVGSDDGDQDVIVR